MVDTFDLELCEKKDHESLLFVIVCSCLEWNKVGVIFYTYFLFVSKYIYVWM